MNDVDVLIVGGGPAGAACALESSKYELSIAIADASDGPRSRLGETLPGKALTLLDRLGVGALFREQGHRAAYAVRSAWGEPELTDRLAINDPYGYGWHVDRRCFDELLLQSVEDRNVRLWAGTRVTHIERQGKGWRVRLRSKAGTRAIDAGILIDATGRSGFLARRLNRRHCAIDRLVGIGRRFRGNREPENWTLVESISGGWWYSVSLPSGDTLAVLMTDADLLGGDIEDFWQTCVAVSSHTRQRLKGLAPRSGSLVQPAVSNVTVHRMDEPFLAIGDAAISCDPLAGQGLTMALETGIAGAIAAVNWLQGSGASFRRYCKAIDDTWRKYLKQRSEVYMMERRWAETPFWKRRLIQA